MTDSDRFLLASGWGTQPLPLDLDWGLGDDEPPACRRPNRAKGFRRGALFPLERLAGIALLGRRGKPRRRT